MHEDRFEFHHLDPEERRELLKTILQKVLESVRKVLLVVAYGSFVSAPAFRDIDIGLYLEHEPRDCLEAEWSISEKLGSGVGHVVDVKILNCAPPDARYSIVRKGIVLYERYRGLANRIATASWKEARDLELKKIKAAGTARATEQHFY